MRQYIVEPGDTLARIAQGLLGSAGKWRVLAEINDLQDPDRLRPGQKLKIPDGVSTPPPPIAEPTRFQGAEWEQATFSEDAGRVYAVTTDGNKKRYLGTKVNAGLRRYGDYPPKAFLQSSAADLRGLQLSTSERNILVSTADNEGALDAINTWDNSFLSFGMFQWTAGQDDAAGELAALLSLVKTMSPDGFEVYWGQHGLGVEGVRGAYGWLTLGNIRLVLPQDKAQLRDYVWALRFARAGADPRVQAIEVLHAVRRLETFYYKPQPLLDGYALAQLISSEYGVALLLDNHVNRPGYLVRSVAGRSPMTGARQRAEVTRGYVVNGIISDQRNTFRSNRNRRTSLQ